MGSAAFTPFWGSIQMSYSLRTTAFILPLALLTSVSLTSLAQTPEGEETEAAPAAEAKPAAESKANSDPSTSASPKADEEARPAADYKHFSVELNPLGVFIGRYGINVGWMPAVHHQLMLNPHYDSVSAEVSMTDFTTGRTITYKDRFSGFGGELGYRFYTGKKGPNGFFVGPAALFGIYSSSASDLTQSTAKSFNSMGFAVDIGGQGVIGPGIVVGGGFGLQYTRVSEDASKLGDLPLSATVLVGGGWRPRFLLSVGYAF